MARLLDESDRPFGTIDDDGIVRDSDGDPIGRVDLYYRSVHAKEQDKKIGYYETNGYVYDEYRNPRGRFFTDGTVKDSRATTRGRVDGGHVESGGAALILFFIQ